MIEILIALFVLAVGLLGFAGLQLMALSSSEEGYLRSQATQLAEDMATRMRANRMYINNTDIANSYVSGHKGAAVAGGYVRYCSIGSTVNTEDDPDDCDAGFCTSAQIAAFDRRQVCDEMRAMGLPDGEIGVRCADRTADADACSGYSRYTIYIGWQPNIKTDRGEKTVAVSGQCKDEMGLTGTKACVAMEVMP